MSKIINIISVSGGKDSTALYCLAFETFGSDFLPIFADTGHEHPVTLNYVRNMHLMLPGAPKIVWVKSDFTDKLKSKNIEASGNPFLDLCLWKGRVPSAKAQFCTEWLKLKPIRDYLELNHALDEWLMFTGIRAEESDRRAKKHPFGWNTWFDCEECLPLLYEPLQAVFDIIKKHGVPPNPLYALGFKRVGCFPCIHSNKTELLLLPDWAWERLEYYEGLIGRTWFAPKTVPGIHIPTIPQVREWSKTSWGGKNYDLFKTETIYQDAPSCMSTWGICE